MDTLVVATRNKARGPQAPLPESVNRLSLRVVKSPEGFIGEAKSDELIEQFDGNFRIYGIVTSVRPSVRADTVIAIWWVGKLSGMGSHNVIAVDWGDWSTVC